MQLTAPDFAGRAFGFGQGAFTEIAPSELAPTLAPVAAHPVFLVSREVAATLLEGEDFIRYATGAHDWTNAGFDKLRAAGWDGRLGTEPDPAQALAARGQATAPSATARPASSAPAPYPASLPTASPRSAAPPLRLATAPKFDHATIMRRAQIGDAAFAAEQARKEATAPLPPLKATSFGDLARQIYARQTAERLRIEAARSGRIRAAGAPQAIDRDVVFDRLARAENRLPDAADIFAQRRAQVRPNR